MLKQQSRFHGNRLGGSGADPPLDMRCALDQAEGPAGMPVRIPMTVTAKPVFEAAGLAKVEELGALILEKVDARLCRERSNN